MRTVPVYIVFVILALVMAPIVRAQKILGFTEAGARQQLEWEKRFTANLHSAHLDSNMKFLAARPHHVGSAQGKINAEYIARQFKEAGFQTDIATYYVLFPTPKTRVLEIVGNKNYKARLAEPAFPEDRTSNQQNEQLPTYNAYSADGDVTAPLVFVNRGIPADYEELEKRGIDVKGKIVIAKYGGSWRGIKPKVAAEHGAVGCIIYSDPEDDGYVKGEVYPTGPFKNKYGVQRGSVMDMPIYPGDPLTPNIAATKDAKRLDISQAVTIMKIPVLPISYEDALPLLETLQGETVPPAWRGALPITYRFGPGTQKIHLKLAFNWDQKPLYNVIATLKGSRFPDEWIIRGNHHDGWVNGAADPLSGMVAEMEEARAIGELVKAGYQLKRTLVYCAWDGEEPALLGSTEWVEDHARELSEKAVLYVNSDGNSRGFLGVAGSHSLEPFMNEVAATVTDPQMGITVKERRYARSIVEASPGQRSKLLGSKNFSLGALGAGSDYSPFFQHLGIASLNIGFGGEASGGEYHSIYDSYDNYIRFKDPKFDYGVALAATAGKTVLRFANAEVLPVDFKSFSKTLAEYVADVKTLIDNMRSETDMENKLVADSLYAWAKDPTAPYILPREKAPVPYLNFSELENALYSLKSSADKFSELYPASLRLNASRQQELNEILYKAERSLLYEKGLPRREWYKHMIYAPGFYTGYGVKTLPAIREGIEEKHWKEAQGYISIVAETIKEYTAVVNKANALLQ